MIDAYNGTHEVQRKKQSMDGFVFGFVDNAVLILGAFTGLEVERWVGGNGARGACFGAAIGNTVSDAIGCVADPALQSITLGVVIGTLIPILFIPAVGWLRDRFAKVAVEEAPADYGFYL